MRNRVFLCLALCLGYCNAFSISDSTVQPADLKKLVGCWEGTLTYLDYSTGKPFTMPANIIVKDFKNANSIIVSYIYPKEPKANGYDTILISADGKTFKGKPVKTKRWINENKLEIITETEGKDGNDNKPAIMRHSYVLDENSYSVKKEVMFVGSNEWILRNEYKFTRSERCD